MIPTKLTLTNLCQHLYLSVVLHRGLTAITGPNGCGKTNFCSTGLMFSITGKVVGMNKSELLRRGASTGNTDLEFLHDGKQCRIVRNLHNSTVRLYGLQEEPLKNKEANDMMVEILGQPFDLFIETCFALQEKFVEPLTQTHAERMAYLQKIADVKRAEVLRGIIQEKGINKLPMYIDKALELEDLEKRLAGLVEEREELEKRNKDLAAMKAEFDPLYDQAQAVLAMTSEADHKAKVHAAMTTLATAEGKLAAFETDKQVQELTPVEPVSAEAHEKAELFETYESWKLKLEDCVQQLKDLKDPEIPTLPPADTFEEGLKDLNERRHQLAAKAKLAEEGVCPTCLRESDVDDPEQAVKDFEAVRNQCAQQEAALEQARRVHADFERAKAVAAEERKRLEDDIERATKSMTLTQDAKDFDIEAHKRHVREWREYSVKLKAQAGLTEMHEKLKGDVRVAKAAHKAASEATHVSDEDRTQAVQFKERYEDLCQRASALDSQMAGVVATEKAVKQQVEGIKKEQEVNAKSRDLRQLFDRGREVLHRDCLPKACMRTMVAYLNSLLAEHLSMFNVNFRAYLDDNFDLVYDDAESEGINVRQLSGGQKVALAIAWKFSISEMLSGKVGLLVLDEPSVWLDDDNIDQVKEVLRAAGRHLSGVGLVSTHEEGLLSAFNNVTDISEQG